MSKCPCAARHQRRRIVLTGGPGAGKTAVLELLRRYLCDHVQVLPEAAGIVYGGGFPRAPAADFRRAAQRAIFHVQREIERAFESEPSALTLCDRGTVDGLAYWVGDDDLMACVGTTLDAELRRYDVVIHLRTPAPNNGYNHQNPLRIESAAEAAAIDARIAQAWAGHPRRFIVEAAPDFLAKAARVIDLVRAELPPCCRPVLAGLAPQGGPDRAAGLAP